MTGPSPQRSAPALAALAAAAATASWSIRETPGTERQTGNPELVALIRDEIGARGRITFARFMELALYHPEYGYYVRSPDRPTRSGDFLTAPETDPVFGATLARQLDEMWRALERPDPFTLREYGAGSGALATAILEGLRSERSGLAEAIRYEPVEVTPERFDAVAERLAGAGYRDVVAPAGSTPDLTGCLLANELLDALPVHRLVVRSGRLREIYVTWQAGEFRDEEGEPSTPALARYLDRVGARLEEGNEADVKLAAQAWVADAGRALRRGYLLVIDYGHPASVIYGPTRPRGTLLAYRGHRVSDDLYGSVGEQDLTTHVDLTGLELAAADAGLELLGRTTQGEFLAGLGLGELLDRLGRDERTDAETYLAARSAVVRFIDPAAMGRFAVVVFGRDVPREVPLRGLSFRLPARKAVGTLE